MLRFIKCQESKQILLEVCGELMKPLRFINPDLNIRGSLAAARQQYGSGFEVGQHHMTISGVRPSNS